MKFTYAEWATIRHAIEVAQNEYEKIMNDSKPSDDKTSMYQIFKRQAREAAELIRKIDNSEI